MDMDELWKALEFVRISTNPDASYRKTDQNYAADLQARQADGQWENFYRAIDALENGCGCQYSKELDLLCRKGAQQDNQRLLKIVEAKPNMIEIVIMLSYVDSDIRLHWIEAAMISNVNVLFECLRKMLQQRRMTEREQNAAAQGLLQLCALSSDRFQYLLRIYVFFRNDCIPVMRAILPRLTEDGWSALGSCVSFDGIDEKRFCFWSQCVPGQDWQSIGSRAVPFLRKWYGALEVNAEKGRVFPSLYNDASNLLIDILLSRLNTPERYIQILEQVVTRTEQAMDRWYENALQQSGTLLAGFSLLAHLRLVWLNQQSPAVSLPNELCQRALRLIKRRQYLWAVHGGAGLCGELRELERWLEEAAAP